MSKSKKKKEDSKKSSKGDKKGSKKGGKKKEESKPTSNVNNNYLLIGVGVLIVLLVAGFFVFSMSDTGSDEVDTGSEQISAGEEEGQTEEATTDIPEDEVAAEVDGEEITGGDIAQLQESSMAQGSQLSEKEAVDRLVETALLMKEAKNEGYDATKDDVEDMLKEELEKQDMSLEEYKGQIEQQGMDYDDFLEQNMDGVIINEYMEDQMNETPEVSDEEIEEYYNMMKQQAEQQEGSEEVPPLEEIEGELKSQLEQQKQMQQQQEVIAPLIESLKEEAEVEYLVDLEESEKEDQESPIEIEQ